MVDLGSGGEERLADGVVGAGVDDGEFAGAAGGLGQSVENRLSDFGIVGDKGEDFDPTTEIPKSIRKFERKDGECGLLGGGGRRIKWGQLRG